MSPSTALEKLQNCKTKKKKTASSTEQKGSFPYSQQPAIRPYTEPD
jgi:hypothetical protein